MATKRTANPPGRRVAGPLDRPAPAAKARADAESVLARWVPDGSCRLESAHTRRDLRVSGCEAVGVGCLGKPLVRVALTCR